MNRKSRRSQVKALVAAVFWFLCLPSSASAAQILVQFDTANGHANAQGRGAIGEPNRGANQVFTSRGFPNGSLIVNATTVPLTDLHLELTSGDTFDPKSTGGAAFPNVAITNNGKTIDFTGGNIPVGSSIWSQIPLTANFPGGVGAYVGRAAPMAAAVPAPQPAPGKPQTGGSTGLNYNGNGGLSIQNFSDAFATYLDGSTTFSNTPFETIIGSQITVSGLQVLGSANGAFQLSNGLLSITNGSSVYLDATIFT
ncbi:MAG: hypothetical protein JO326_13780 [Acetobacteraceae bacterium]|nr:hypothetical protein [Acetobacteraceae bacterium]